jgi:hypothetical protein
MEATRITRRPGARKKAAAVGKAEEVTRITKQPGAQGNAAAVRAESPPRVPAQKVSASKTPPALLPLARFALVALVFGRERAPELLEGLGVREAERAKEHLAHLTALSSAQRQARVAVEFGMRKDPADPLRELMAEAPEALRRELFRRLPPYLRSLFPERGLEPPDASATPALCALAERLIREATR